MTQSEWLKKQNKTKQGWKFRFRYFSLFCFVNCLQNAFKRLFAMNGQISKPFKQRKSFCKLRCSHFSWENGECLVIEENLLPFLLFFIQRGFCGFHFVLLMFSLSWQYAAARKRDSEAIVRQYPDKVPVRQKFRHINTLRKSTCMLIRPVLSSKSSGMYS